MFQIKPNQIFSFLLGTFGFLALGSLMSPILSFAQIQTPDLSQDSVINFDNFDGSQEGIAGIILSIARFIIFIVGAVAVLFLLWGAVQYLTAGGDDAKAKNGKTTIINAIVGLVLAILSFTIVQVIQTILLSGSLSNILGG